MKKTNKPKKTGNRSDTPTMLACIGNEKGSTSFFAKTISGLAPINGVTFAFYLSSFTNPRQQREELQDGYILRIYPK